MSDTIDLTPVVKAINRSLEQVQSQLSSQIDGVGSEVGRVRSDLRLTSDELRQLRQEFDQFVAQAARAAAVQQAETKVGNLRAQLDREFGHYGAVRRTSVGVLQAFDVGIISNDAVRSVSEELMLQTPRYWLAPALVALAAWSRDNQTIGEKAVREAFARDKNKTSLFFALVLRRQGRQSGAVRWLRHYFASLDPTALTREFAVILEAASHDAFGPAGQQLVTRLISGWCGELRARAEVEEAQIQNWAGEIGIRRGRLDDTHYPALALLSPQWPDLKRQIESAAALSEVLDKFEAVKAHDAPLPTGLEDMLDDILDQLVTEYDEEELPLKREVVYNEAVIEEGGDLERARGRADELNRALEETNDIVTLQTMAAINPGSLGVSIHTQRVAIGAGVGDFRAAVSRYCAAYRADAIGSLTFSFDQKHSNYASAYLFKGCSVSSQMPESEGISRISDAWKRTMDEHIERVSFKNRWYAAPVALAVVAALVLFAFGAVPGIIGLLGGAGVVFALGEHQKRKCAEQVAKLEWVRNEATAHSVGLYRDAIAQLVDARVIYEELDARESDLLRLIDTWPTAEPVEEAV